MNTGQYLEIISGRRRGGASAGVRVALSTMMPFFAGVVYLRNRLYDLSLLSATRLSHPVISVGNLTAGGTGKTPMIRFLAGWLRDEGMGVAVLSRGYKSRDGQPGDEQRMLDSLLNNDRLARVVIKANPNRVAAAGEAITEHSNLSVFLLDDGFQHRRVSRDLDLVLISAVEPFGYGNMLPRGLLREPLSALGRADLVVITHADRVSASAIKTIEQTVGEYCADIPIIKAAHAPCGFRTSTTDINPLAECSLGELAGRRFFAFCGLADPSVFLEQLESVWRHLWRPTSLCRPSSLYPRGFICNHG